MKSDAWLPSRSFFIRLLIFLIAYKSCRVTNVRGTVSHTTTQAQLCLESLMNITARPNYESLFYKVDIISEIKKAVNGTPLEPLPDYKTPCWFIGTKNKSRSCAKCNRFYNQTVQHGQLVARLRCLPYAKIIGVSKCGTTDLFYRLSKHPQIFTSKRKEVRFWSRCRIGMYALPGHPREEMSFKKYLNFFDDAAREIYEHTEIVDHKVFHPGIAMEATPHYLWDYGGWETIPGNIGLSEPRFILPHTLREVEPELKFLVILRNPVDRIYSQFRMRSRGGDASLFHDLVTKSLLLWNDCLTKNSLRSCAYNASLIPYEFSRPGGITLRAGMYWIFLKDWLEVYSRTRFYIIKSEHYYSNVSSTLEEAFTFLGTNPIDDELMKVFREGGIQNQSNSSEPMLPETRKMLNNLYKPFNENLAKLLADNDYLWE